MTLITPPRHEVIIDAYTNDRVHIGKRCMLCDGSSHIIVDKEAWTAWRQGTYCQHAFPNMSIGDRETLISGSHSDCFDEAFKEDDDS